MSYNVKIYVEGYHDRSFLQGWLLRRGWTEQRVMPGTAAQLGSGTHGFMSPNGATFMQVTPTHGDRSLLVLLKSKVVTTSPADEGDIVIVLDIDNEDRAEGARRREESVHDCLMRGDPGTTRTGPSWMLSSGVRVHLALWSCEDPDCEGVPRRHTLERLVCVAIARGYPERATAVQAWLDARPEPPRSNDKEHSWSYMAGWYARLNCDRFFSDLWRDPKISSVLDDLLSASGVEDIVRRFE